ncbi:MAG: nucleoside phosphorylase [Clostridia bacterium]|nr:nucleoside phosphorylase [Clostridia bacterium]
MITDSFDNKSEPLFTPEHFLGPQKHLSDICLLTFSHVILKELMTRFTLSEVGTLDSANGSRPIYVFEFGGRTIAAFLCGIGSTIAGNDVVELNWEIGATKFIMFGSAGNLNREATAGKYVIPTEAYRDEGLSYHYAPPADYIAIKNADATAAFFDELRLPYVMGRVWTTDAFYRETKDQVAARQKEGCLAVEMELAGVEAVCDFHGFELYNFLVTGDVLDAPVYENGELRSANHDLDKLDIALEIVKRI